MADKVRFGISNVHYAVLNDDGSYSTPVAIPGAVAMSLEASGDTTTFYADNMPYYVTAANNGYTGDLEVALFPASFYQDILGFIMDTTAKVLIEDATAQPKSFALLWEEAGDAGGAKHLLYNCTCTRPQYEFNTTSESKEPQTQTTSITAAPLSNGRSYVATTADTPTSVISAWYTKVWMPTEG